MPVHVALLFSPGTDPRSPHLALPSLAATLRDAGARLTVRDVDLEGLLALLEPANVAEAVGICRARRERTSDETERSRLSAVLTDADDVVARVGDAPARLRDPEMFYQPHVYHGARDCIGRALAIVSAASGPVDYGIDPMRYEVAGVDIMRLADLAVVTADPSTNLFERIYRERVLPDLDRDRPDVVAVSILNYQQVIPGLTLARRLKDQGHFVVIGGTVYTKFVPNLVARPDFFRLFCDGLIAYEGETALLELLDQLAGRRDLGAVPNYLYLDADGQVRFTRYHVEDVDRLPTPSFDDFPLDQYLAPAPVLPILTGKGCYFNRCKFCDIPFINHISKKAYRLRSPERVAADVATLFHRYGARHFEITDEALSPKLLLRLADALDDYPEVQPRFIGYARLEPAFTPEVCRRIHEMGVRKLFFGLESGSQATLDHMDKGINVAHARDVLRNCADAGIGFHLFSIVGFPEESEERARETLAFFLDNASTINHPRNSFDIHPFSLDLRTEYADNPERFGVEIDRVDLAGRDFPFFAPRWRNTRGMDRATATRLIDEFHAELRRTFRDYHSYPVYLWPGFEEYSLLYADHYERQPFAYRLSLPPDGDPLAFRLIWGEHARFEPTAGGYLVRGLYGETTVTEAALRLLARPREPRPVAELIEDLLDTLAPTRGRDELAGEVREVVDRLLGAGALQLEPVHELVALTR